MTSLIGFFMPGFMLCKSSSIFPDIGRGLKLNKVKQYTDCNVYLWWNDVI